MYNFIRYDKENSTVYSGLFVGDLPNSLEILYGVIHVIQLLICDIFIVEAGVSPYFSTVIIKKHLAKEQQRKDMFCFL